MKAILNLQKDYTSNQIKKAVSTLNQYRQAKGEEIITSWEVILKSQKPKVIETEPVQTSDHQPCGDCGGTFFLRTGTCHVCQTCGASQGCS